ncbi:MAG TPA: RHS repeat-associated core domain-containing protein [Tepidisphaeraceae bacterium]|jgi:hypothetical protein|nr:RHS repeat-associated core domain-containing protein [Tepidisphaeraceae bacterium]
MSYDPALGRWLETDPEQYVDGPNLYQMESGNPVGLLDPTGEQATTQPGSGFTIPSGKNGRGSGSFTIGQGPNTGTVTIKGRNNGAGSANGNGPEGGIEASFVPDSGCCKDLSWSQTVKIDILNPGPGNPNLQGPIQKEINEHGGNNPFLGPVLDNGPGGSWGDFRHYEDGGGLQPAQFAPQPPFLNSFKPQPPSGSANFRDEPWWPSTDWPDGVTVRKTFVLSLYCGGKPLGISINWQVTATTSGQPGATTSVNVSVSGPSVKPL